MKEPSCAEREYQQQEDRLRVKIAAHFKRADIPEELWSGFPETIAEVLEAEDAQERSVYEKQLIQGLKKGWAKANAIAGKNVPPGRSANAVPQYQATPAEMEREATIRNYYSAQLSELPGVQHFRQQLGSLMPPERVWSFLTSPLTQLFGFAELEAWDVDPLSAEGEVVDEETVAGVGSESLHQVTVLIRPRGVRKTVTHDPKTMFVLMSNKLIGDAQFLLDTYVTRPEQRVLFPDFYFSPFPVSGRQYREIVGYEGTVAGEALRLSDDIAVRHHLEARSALLFLLTGQMPYTNPVQTVLVPRPHYGLDGKAEEATWGPVALVVQPWVSGPALQGYYRVLQHEMFGKDNRPIKEQSLALFDFVNAHWGKVAGKTKTQKWENLLELWRETTQGNPRQTAYSDSFDWRNLREAYHRIKKVLLPPLR